MSQAIRETHEPEPVEDLLRAQDGLVSRRQLADRGWRKHHIVHMLRSRQWARVFDGVYADHTGDLSWKQRAWAAVLLTWPAALAGRSALRAVAGPGWHDHDERGPIEVAAALGRTVVARPGVVVRRVPDLEMRTQGNAHPPRLRFEQALLDRLADVEGDWRRIELVAAACRSRCTTATRLREALEARARYAGRAWLRSLLADVEAGTASVLEHGYLHRVERAHALPAPGRQASSSGPDGRVYRDVDYAAYGVVVELDGLLFHSSTTDRDRDLDRDLAAAATETGGPCGSAGARSSTAPAAPPVPSRRCWSATGGRDRPPRADPSAGSGPVPPRSKIRPCERAGSASQC